LQLRRSQLFVPGNDERKIQRALFLEDCDSVILDLEDAVPPSEKSTARQTIKKALSSYPREGGTREICVRLNPIDSQFFDEDIFELKEGALQVGAVVVPKCDVKAAKEVRLQFPDKRVIPLIETAQGFLELEDVVRCEGVSAVSYGAADFANSVGGSLASYLENDYVKTKIVIAAKAYGVDPIDNVFFNLSDPEAFRRDALKSKNLGFVGKQVIHPSQVEIANEVFSPSVEEVQGARKIIEAYESASEGERKKGALLLDGRLVDAVHYRNAKWILDRSALIQDRASNLI
jgi:citrate lyase subunit beta/citryl-CoA lyase